MAVRPCAPVMFFVTNHIERVRLTQRQFAHSREPPSGYAQSARQRRTPVACCRETLLHSAGSPQRTGSPTKILFLL
jgi:hypothetical protein